MHLNPELFEIENKIYTIRGMQVMLDSDLANLYGTETKFINRAVKRNPQRFPESFVFQLSEKEWESLRFQLGTLKTNLGRGEHRKYLPKMFTEQGVAMLSSVLNTETAIQVSIQIMQAFVSMRKFLFQNASVFQRLDQLEIKQLQSEEKMDQIFKALEARYPEPEKGIFFDGQIFDAYAFVAGLIKTAKKEILVIDNYVDESVLTLLTKRPTGVKAVIFTKSVTKPFQLDLEKHNAQYPKIEVRSFTLSHDRFLILDRTELYHLGASLKDLGKKWFAFSRMDSMVSILLKQLILDDL